MPRAVAGLILSAVIVFAFGCPDPQLVVLDAGVDSGVDGGDSDGGTTCSTEVIDSDAVAKYVSYVSLALDPAGVPHAAYFDAANSALKYARRGSAGWSAEAVTDGGAGGSLVSLALSSAGKAHVSYYNSGDSSVRYASNSSGGWAAEKIADGASSSLALDATGAVRVVFTRNVAPKSLQIAYRTGSTWTSQDIDAVGENDQPSFAIDAAGKGHVSYLERTSQSFKYATDVSGAWQTQSIDVGGVGSNSSLAVDSGGKVHVTYFDSTNARLKYATNASGTWVATTVDAAGTVGPGKTSLAIDSRDKLHVTYYEGPEKDLGYVTNAGGAWVARPLVSGAADFGNASSLAIDSAASALHAAYSDRTSGAVRYVLCK